MLIAEIILTIFAWRKGWKWFALIPTGVALIMGLLLGAGIAASGGDVSGISFIGMFFDIAAIIALIFMVAIAPKSKENPSDSPKNA